MHKKVLILFIGAAAAAAAAWYAYRPLPANQSLNGYQPGEGAIVKVASAEKVGEYLTDGAGRSLYIFASDEDLKSNCLDTCAKNWPPYLIISGRQPLPESDSGILSKINAFKRDDGSRQYSLGGQPLYYYAGDARPGDVLGDGVNNVWSLARPQ